MCRHLRKASEVLLLHRQQMPFIISHLFDLEVPELLGFLFLPLHQEFL